MLEEARKIIREAWRDIPLNPFKEERNQTALLEEIKRIVQWAKFQSNTDRYIEAIDKISKLLENR